MLCLCSEISTKRKVDSINRTKPVVKKACIIEYNDYHDEIIPSLIFALNTNGFHVDVYLSEGNIKKQLFPLFENDLKFELIPISNKVSQVRAISGFVYRKFYRYVKGIKTYTGTIDNALINSRNYDVIIFNSVEPLPVLYQCANFTHANVFYVQHNSFLLKEHPEYKKKITLERTIVLSHHIKHYLNADVKIITPVYFANFSMNKLLDKKCVKFCVQGNFDSKRRNYMSLLNAVNKLHIAGLRNFSVEILGNSNTEEGNLFKTIALKYGISEYFTIHDAVLPYLEYYHKISNCDYVLPLIDNQNLSHFSYELWKCSSTINLSIGLGVVPCISDYYKSIYNLHESCISYSNDDVYTAMLKAIELSEKEYIRLQSNLNRLKKNYLEENHQIFSKI